MSRARAMAREALDEHFAVQQEAELAELIDALSGREIRRVLEVGVFHGGTLWVWAQLATSDATILGLDREIGLRENWYGKPGQRVLVHQADSQTAEALEWVEQQLGDERLDLLHIDADHSHDGVASDWAMYSPLVADGGLIVIHDVRSDDMLASGMDVGRFWKELDTPHLRGEIVCPDETWGGYGIVEVGKWAD